MMARQGVGRPEGAGEERRGWGKSASMREAEADQTNAKVRETMTAAIELSADGFLQQINEYECIRDLGAGATAEVKLCRRVDKQTGEEEWVAVKVFNKSLLNRQARGFAFGRRKKDVKRDSQVLQNVRREVALMKKLVHPNVVRLLEVIDDPQNDLLFMAMEFVHNGPVMRWEESTGQYVSPSTGGVLPPKTAAGYFRGMLDGLEFLHGNHVVHRDLKPENVLLTKDGVAKLADFGVAQVFDEQELQPDSITPESVERHRHQLTQPEGTWCFWAPEICTTSAVASERALEAAATRARGAEAAKAMALGRGGGGSAGGLSVTDSAISGMSPSPIIEGEVLSTSNNHNNSSSSAASVVEKLGKQGLDASARHSLRRQGTYNAFAADVWAAGVCLWVFRFGTPPFYNTDPSLLFLEICKQPLLFPPEVDEGDEEVLRQEAQEARRLANRAAAVAQAAAAEADRTAAEAAEEVARREKRRERGTTDRPFVRPIQIPEELDGDGDDVDDMVSPGQLPALGSGERMFGGRHNRGGSKDDGSGNIAVSNGDVSTRRPNSDSPAVNARLRRSRSTSHTGASGAFDHGTSGGRGMAIDDGNGRGGSSGGGGGGSGVLNLRRLPKPKGRAPSRDIPPEHERFGRSSKSGGGGSGGGGASGGGARRQRPDRSSSVTSDRDDNRPIIRPGSGSFSFFAEEAAESAVAESSGASHDNGYSSSRSRNNQSNDSNNSITANPTNSSSSSSSSSIRSKINERHMSWRRYTSGGMASGSAVSATSTAAPSSLSSSYSSLVGKGGRSGDVVQRSSSNAGGENGRVSGGNDKAPPARSASHPVVGSEEAYSPAEVGGSGIVGVGVGGVKTSGTLHNLLSLLLHKQSSERISVREAQEHPWMRRMAPRREGGSGTESRAGSTSRRSHPPPFQQVSVSAVEVKGAIVHLNRLFVISMVKSRITQRLTRARKNIARRRLQATTSGKYGPSLSDTEQEHLREVRDLTEALKKDEAVLINHHLANEPERSLSDSDLPTATSSGTWGGGKGTAVDRKNAREGTRGGGEYRSNESRRSTDSRRNSDVRGTGSASRRGGGRSRSGETSTSRSKISQRLYARSASQIAGRDSVHNAISNFFGPTERDVYGGGGGGGGGSGGSGGGGGGGGGGRRVDDAVAERKSRLKTKSSRGKRRSRRKDGSRAATALAEYLHASPSWGQRRTTAAAAAATPAAPAAPTPPTNVHPPAAPPGGAAALTGLTSLSKSFASHTSAMSGVSSLSSNACVTPATAADARAASGLMNGGKAAGAEPGGSSGVVAAGAGAGAGEGAGAGVGAGGFGASKTPGAKARMRFLSRVHSMHSVSTVRGFESSSSLSDDSWMSSSECSFSDDDDNSAYSSKEHEADNLGMLRYDEGPMESFGSEGSSRSANSQRARGSFRVFGIQRRTLKMKPKISRMRMPRMRRGGSSGAGEPSPSVGPDPRRGEGQGGPAAPAGSADGAAVVAPRMVPTVDNEQCFLSTGGRHCEGTPRGSGSRREDPADKKEPSLLMGMGGRLGATIVGIKREGHARSGMPPKSPIEPPGGSGSVGGTRGEAPSVAGGNGNGNGSGNHHRDRGVVNEGASTDLSSAAAAPVASSSSSLSSSPFYYEKQHGEERRRAAAASAVPMPMAVRLVTTTPTPTGESMRIETAAGGEREAPPSKTPPSGRDKRRTHPPFLESPWKGSLPVRSGGGGGGGSGSAGREARGKGGSSQLFSKRSFRSKGSSSEV